MTFSWKKTAVYTAFLLQNEWFLSSCLFTQLSCPIICSVQCRLGSFTAINRTDTLYDYYWKHHSHSLFSMNKAWLYRNSFGLLWNTFHDKRNVWGWVFLWPSEPIIGPCPEWGGLLSLVDPADVLRVDQFVNAAQSLHPESISWQSQRPLESQKKLCFKLKLVDLAERQQQDENLEPSQE